MGALSHVSLFVAAASTHQRVSPPDAQGACSRQLADTKKNGTRRTFLYLKRELKTEEGLATPLETKPHSTHTLAILKTFSTAPQADSGIYFK